MGEAGDTGDVVHDLRDEVASLEDALSQMGTSSKMPYHMTQQTAVRMIFITQALTK